MYICVWGAFVFVLCVIVFGWFLFCVCCLLACCCCFVGILCMSFLFVFNVVWGAIACLLLASLYVCLCVCLCVCCFCEFAFCRCVIVCGLLSLHRVSVFACR